jgi:hypothetical protein
VVSFTPRPLYPRKKSPRYPLYRRLGVPQSRSGQHGEVKILDPTGTRTPTSSVVQPVGRYVNKYCIVGSCCILFPIVFTSINTKKRSHKNSSKIIYEEYIYNNNIIHILGHNQKVFLIQKHRTQQRKTRRQPASQHNKYTQPICEKPHLNLQSAAIKNYIQKEQIFMIESDFRI